MLNEKVIFKGVEIHHVPNLGGDVECEQYLVSERQRNAVMKAGAQSTEELWDTIIKEESKSG